MRKLLFMFGLLVFVLAACNGEATTDTTINFETFGGDPLDSIEVALDGDLDLPEPSKDGHVFDGWFVDEDFTTEFSRELLDTDGVTVYAKWLEVFTVTYVVDGEVYESFEVTEGDEAPIPDEPTLEDMVFDGWFMDEDYTEAYNTPHTVENDVSIYARFAEIMGDVTVRYEHEDGSFITTQTYDVDDELIFPDDPEKLGHSFQAWLLDGEPIDENVLLTEDKTLVAHFEVLTYTITFETGDAEPVEPFTAEFDAPIEFPTVSLEDMQFAGWYEDSDFEVPFTLTTMPAEDMTIYARFEEAGEAFTLESIITARPEMARVENATVIYTETMEFDDVTITILQDDTASIFAMGLEDVSVGDVISFDGTFIYINDVLPNLVAAENVEVESTTEVTLDVEAIDLETLRTMAMDDPFNVGTFYTIDAPVLVEEGAAVIDPDTMNFYPIVNLHDEHSLFDDLDHYYVNFGFTPIPFDMDMLGLLYVEAAGEMTSLSITTEEKLDIIEEIVTNVIEAETYQAGMGLFFPEFDPIFGSAMTLEATGDNADLYNAELDEFEAVSETTLIDFTVTLELEGVTREVTATATVEPHTSDLIIDGHTLEMGTLDVVIIYASGRGVIAQDDSGLIALENYTDTTLTVGNRYILDVGFMQNGPLVSGYIMSVVGDQGSAPITLDAIPYTLDDLTALEATNHAGKYIELEGMLFESADQNATLPYVLRDEDTKVYIVSNNPEVLSAFDDNLFDTLTVEGYLIDYSMDSETYILYFPYDVGALHFESTDDTEIFTVLESIITDIETPLRPNETTYLPAEISGVEITYALDGGDLDKVDFISDERGAFITFTEAGTVTISVALTYGELTHEFTFELEAEDYDVNTIAYAQSLPEGTQVTLLVEVQAMHTDFHLVLSDGTGEIMLNANTIPYWLMPGDTMIISGHLEASDGVDWLMDATVEVQDVPVDVTLVEPDVWTIEDLLALENPYEGIMYVEVSGTLSTRAHIDGLALFDADENYIELGIDYDRESQFWATYYGNEITIRGYFLTDQYGDNTIALERRVQTEFEGTISEFYDFEETTRVRVTAYGFIYMFDGMYMIDETGIIPIRGIADAWAQNRQGQVWEFYGDVEVENGRRYIDISSFDFITAYDGDYEDFAVTPEAIDFFDFMQLDFSSDDPYKTVYESEAFVAEEDGVYTLLDTGQEIEVNFEDGPFDGEDFVGETVIIEFIVFASFEDEELFAYPLEITIVND